jgi:membrane-associated protease RseP (regulator of RpoE activity)
MINRFLLSVFLLAWSVSPFSSAQPGESNYSGSSSGSNYDRGGEIWDGSSDEGGGGSSYLGVDIADVSAERLSELKLKEEHGAEVTMVDQDAPAGKAGLHEHDVIVSVNGTAVESAAQLRRMIKETPPGRVVNLGISRDGQPLSVKVQLADRHKSMEWEPKIHPEMPKVQIPNMPDFDLPVSVVIVHSSARSGLMVENMTPQLGEFFGVKGGNGVLVRSVEKGSRGDKAGFRAGDVIVKVNNQTVHDSSDFTHAVRSSQGGSASVTLIRDKKEQKLTLPLPEKKDSGSLLEDSFEVPDFSAETQDALNRVREEVARLSPAIRETVHAEAERVQRQATRCRDAQKIQQDSQQKMQDRELQMQKQQQRLRQELSGKWISI